MASEHEQALLHFDELVARVDKELCQRQRWKVVRHMDKRLGAPDLLRLYFNNREDLEYYQRDQSSDIFSGCEGIFSFLGLPGRKALFFGAYHVRGMRIGVPPDVDTEVPVGLREFYRAQGPQVGQPLYIYDLVRDSRFAALELRVVIDWGKGALAWHQHNLHKAVVELRELGHHGPCPDYLDIDISLAEMAHIHRHETANVQWKERLSAVGGIYLLSDPKNCKLYVGQAGSDGGFWKRWCDYAEGKTGNKYIDGPLASGIIDARQATLSILSVLPRQGITSSKLNALEAKWKRRLFSRETGWNAN